MSDDRFPDGAGVSEAEIRLKIEVAAFEVFEQSGFEHSTVSDLAAAAGVSEQEFLSHFETRVDAVLVVQQELLRGAADQLAALPTREFSLFVIESTVVDVLTTLAAEESAAGRLLRLRSLLITDGPFRAAVAAHLLTQTNPWEVWATNQPTASNEDKLKNWLTFEIASATVRAAFDTWAAESAAGSERTLLEVYRHACALARLVVA